MKNPSIKQCLELLRDVELTFAHRCQLESLVREYGILGAIEYLKPLSLESPGRDQVLADTHRQILEAMV